MNNVFNYSPGKMAGFEKAIEEYGWVVFENALDNEQVDRINADLINAHRERKEIQLKNGISANMDGTLHHLLERDNFALELLQKMYCHDEISRYFDGKYILNGINAIIHAKQEHPYLSNMHRDVRTFMGDTKLLVQMIITLDDFNLLNGATYFLSGSHKTAHKPAEDYFYDCADRANAPKGSIILFNSNIWHAAGRNFTSKPRRALTLGFSPPYIKPQFDYCRFLGYDFVSALSPQLRQVIGYNARTPENLNEYYQPVHLRMYQPDQG
ncbi:MAG: phytanoyl-CoA dioxygenase family protein [Bacteroidota bacterium]|nr:phytanoyl-CoA dioxygenase family protein [Bacteroidota bacterium]